ncbi:hypothetical protein [Caminicella sporogenes]|uniref:hypothetical protein n=1 Tax=Caminicella sporogenes TaxID=166485 RepID=UPI00253FD724|nr:hypothetical protein [Caminicella sporogenes]WIF94466.1 hypothetical protein QNI18_09370 [Caminicella sporogenes]
MMQEKQKVENCLDKSIHAMFIRNRLSHAVLEEKKRLEREGYFVPNTTLYVQGDTRQKFEPEKHFTKSFKNKIDEIKKEFGLTLTEMGIIYTLSFYINYEDNLLCHSNGNPLCKKDLQEILDLAHNAVDKYMNFLVKKGVLAKVKVKRSVNYYMNPYIFYKGNRIDNTLLNMFNKAK